MNLLQALNYNGIGEKNNNHVWKCIQDHFWMIGLVLRFTVLVCRCDKKNLLRQTICENYCLMS